MFKTVKQRARMLRITIGITIALVVLAGIGLAFESLALVSYMPNRGLELRLLRLVLLGMVNLSLIVVLVMLGALAAWVHMARSLPDLKGWHVEYPNSEFRARDAVPSYTFDDYLAQEAQVFQELDAYCQGEWREQASAEYNRFNTESICSPEHYFDQNWNRTHILRAANPVGGALLLHGLSDSPYSLRAMGQRLHAEGYTVCWLRVPGHGTNPRSLAEVTWKDWTHAVRIAMNGLRKEVPSGAPVILVGYSNGGALSLNQALLSTEDKTVPQADAVILFSPMIGVNPLAKITRLHHVVGGISRNEKAKWSSVHAEIDPFKYCSWPMNGNVQAWSLTQVVERKLAALEKSKRMHELPPILAMQSVVDSTVSVPKLITTLFDRLTTPSSELFLFDVNRRNALSNLLNLSFERSVLPKLERTDKDYRLTVLTNARPETDQLLLRRREHEKWTEQEVELTWPRGVVSLSHVAVPFALDDPVYGATLGPENWSLGSISMRAEPSALMIPSSLFVRCRHNPFYEFMEDRVISWVRQNVAT